MSDSYLRYVVETQAHAIKAMNEKIDKILERVEMLYPAGCGPVPDPEPGCRFSAIKQKKVDD